MGFSRFYALRIAYRSAQSISRMTVWLALVSIMLGVAVMEVAVSVVYGFEREVERKILGFVSDIQIGVYLNPMEAAQNRMKANDPVIRRLPQEFPEITSISAYINRHCIIKSPATMEGVQAKGVGKDWNSRFIGQSLKAGRLPVLPDTGYGKEVLISRRLANLLEIDAGSKIKLYFLERERVRVRPVTVSGIYETGLTEFDQAVVFCDVRLLQRILGWEKDEVEGFEVRLAAGFPPDRIIEPINDKLAFDQHASTAYEMHPETFKWLDLQHQNVYFILALMTLVAVINMASTILILITERINAIGLLKAIGATNRQVQGIFLWNAFFMIGAGILAGNLLGLSLLWLQEQTHWFVLDQDSYFVREAPVAWVWEQFLIINAGVAMVCTLCMVIPTLIVNSISPIRAIRFE